MSVYLLYIIIIWYIYFLIEQVKFGKNYFEESRKSIYVKGFSKKRISNEFGTKRV